MEARSRIPNSESWGRESDPKNALQLFVFHGDMFLGAELFFTEVPLIVGRDTNAGLRLAADTVSRRHCRFLWRDEALILEDLDSGNGTFVNDRRIKTSPVRFKDTIRLGPYSLKARVLNGAGQAPVDSIIAEPTTRLEAIFEFAEATVQPFDEVESLQEDTFDLSHATSDTVVDTAVAIIAEPDTLQDGGERRTNSFYPGREPRLSADVEARLRDLDELLESLNDQYEVDEDSVPPKPETLAEALTAHLVQEGTFRPKDTLPLDRTLSIIPRQSMDTRPTVADIADIGTKRPLERPAPPNLLEAFSDPDSSGRAHIETPSHERVAVIPVDPSERPAPAVRPNEQRAGAPKAGKDRAPRFHGIEIAARLNHRLVCMTILKYPGEEYVLGHPTPDGQAAPARDHVGLRMVKINEDRTVDLVFPHDVGGHLVRGHHTVAMSSLTEGRKYSCLRLNPADIAVVFLGGSRHGVSYHLRFLRRPASIIRSLKRTPRS
ncbi:MAG: FHA domain-containing protein [Myxococcota bacterium]